MTSVPTGIDLTRFVPGDAVAARARLGLPERPTLGIVATLRDWKGHEYLFDAIARDKAAWAGWQVIVVGDGPYRDRLDQGSALGLTDCTALSVSGTMSCRGRRSIFLCCLRMAKACRGDHAGDGVRHSVVSTPVGAISERRASVTGLVAPRSAEALSISLAALRDDPPLNAFRRGEAYRLDFGRPHARPHGRVSPVLGGLTYAGIAGFFGKRTLPRRSSCE
jgi:hypothetical protein